MGKSDKGQRGALMRPYEMYADLEDQEEVQAGASTDVPTPSGDSSSAQSPHASERPMMVMIDESTGNKYMRSVDHKGLGPDGDNSWLVKDMHQEGNPGGTQGVVEMRSS